MPSLILTKSDRIENGVWITSKEERTNYQKDYKGKEEVCEMRGSSLEREQKVSFSSEVHQMDVAQVRGEQG